MEGTGIRSVTYVIKKLVLKNFRGFQQATIEFRPDLNILVGNNEAGKSTILEAINLALTGRVGRGYPYANLSPHLINRQAAEAYISSLGSREPKPPPEILIELYLEHCDRTASLCGTNNSLRENGPGVRLEIRFDEDFKSEYEIFLSESQTIKAVPIEYYTVDWRSFAGTRITRRGLGITAAVIDATKIRLTNGADYYMQQIIADSLTETERVRLARAYRSLKETFAERKEIATLNESLGQSGSDVTEKELALSVDDSPESAWESTLMPYLDDIPFQYAGGGERSSLKILLALSRRVENLQVVLIEEPENHLAYSLLNRLIRKIRECVGERQVILTTHSSFVLNKLGLDHLMLIRNRTVSRLGELPEDTLRYFERLPGYDTLRMVLADRVILVEGPSDELVVQRAYFDMHKRLPIQDGIDVISVWGLSFTRFLDIAAGLRTRTAVVTDNDGYPDRLVEKYQPYKDGNDCIEVFYSFNADLPTLEPNIVACNDLATLNAVLDRDFATKEEVERYMGNNKTEVALRIFEAPDPIQMPTYIRDACQ
jgi:putative ATP-dependent endonuclease of OLD family